MWRIAKFGQKKLRRKAPSNSVATGTMTSGPKRTAREEMQPSKHMVFNDEDDRYDGMSEMSDDVDDRDDEDDVTGDDNHEDDGDSSSSEVEEISTSEARAKARKQLEKAKSRRET